MQRILEGTTVCGGVITGNVRIVADTKDVVRVQDGDIVVLPCSHPQYAVGVMRGSGLICEEGGIISHICTVALEMGIPCITQAKGAIEVMKNHTRVTLNADEGAVYGA
ncbi:MAG TPA: PEP-utilizing enzyme [Blastocatellia bacterium]|jgi:phosphohistidine swiveling domain-containing protein|nr:PEP-utilizing enzyme [Blastocatellia bacterium]